MGIRQLRSSALRVRFQHRSVPFAVTYPGPELAEDAKLLLQTAAMVGRRDAGAAHDNQAPPSSSPARGHVQTSTPDEVRSSSAGAAGSIDTILTEVIDEAVDPTPAAEETLTAGQAATLLGVSRPTLVAWLEAGRIPFHRCGTHRQVRRSELHAYRDRLRGQGHSRHG